MIYDLRIAEFLNSLILSYFTLLKQTFPFRSHGSNWQPNEPVSNGNVTENGKKALPLITTKTPIEVPTLPVDDFHIECEARKVNEGEFEVDKHFYPRVLNAEVHSSIETFLSLSNDRMIARHTNLNPRIKPEILKRILSYSPTHFQWAGKKFWLNATTIY